MIDPNNAAKLCKVIAALLPLLGERAAIMRPFPRMSEACPESFEKLRAIYNLSAVECDNIGFTLGILSKMAVEDPCDCPDCTSIKKLKDVVIKGAPNTPAEPDWQDPD